MKGRTVTTTPCELLLSPRGSVDYFLAVWGWRPLSSELGRYKLHKNVPSSFGVFPRFRRHTSCHFLINYYMEVAERQAWLNIMKGSHMIVETLPGWVRRVGGLVSSTAVILRGTLGFCLLDCRMRRGSLCFFSWLHSEILGHIGKKAVQRGELGQGRAARKDLLNDGDAEWSLKGRMSTSEKRELYTFILNK